MVDVIDMVFDKARAASFLVAALAPLVPPSPDAPRCPSPTLSHLRSPLPLPSGALRAALRLDVLEKLCAKCAEKFPEFPDETNPEAKPHTFKRLLLNKCREEFEKENSIQEQIDALGADATDARRRRR